MKKLLFVALSLLALASPGRTQQTTSTVNPNLPSQNAPLASGPVRGNFAAAYNDINYLLGLFGTGGIRQPVVINLNTVATASLPASFVPRALRIVGADGGEASMEIVSFGGTPAIACTRADGTGASPTAPLTGEQICSLNANGYNGTGFTGGRSSFRTFAAENWTPSANGAYTDVYTTASGTASQNANPNVRFFGSLGTYFGATPVDPGANNLTVQGGVMVNNALQVGGTGGITLVQGEIGLNKITTSGSAPGAGSLKFEVVAGTTGGTCKIIAYAGTSTTPTTVVDNVGTGC